MLIEKVHNDIRYTLSNDNLVNGDKVYPIAIGRCLPDGSWILNELDFRDFMSGFPDKPHTIKDLNYDNGRQGKPYEVSTDMGFSPKERYYKIIKKEKYIKKERIVGSLTFIDSEWVEI